MSRETIGQDAHQAVLDTALDFHLQATTVSGVAVDVPCSYQIVESGFRPYLSGKGSPEELQQKLDTTITSAAERGEGLGIESQDSLRKLAIQLGLGIDCSNFAYRALTLVHNRLELPSYASTVFRKSSDILSLYESKGSWRAKDEDGELRELTPVELDALTNNGVVDVEWISSVFGKDPQFITGSMHIADIEATDPTDPDNLQPGDIIAFNKAAIGTVSHVAIVESVDDTPGGVHVDFWHSWHTRDFDSGLRRDNVSFSDSPEPSWSHQGLSDPKRYKGHQLLRPKLVSNITTLEN